MIFFDIETVQRVAKFHAKFAGNWLFFGLIHRLMIINLKIF